MKIFDRIKLWFKEVPSLDMGDSMYYLGHTYLKNPEKKCNIGDEVIIHSVIGKSQTLQSYPAKIVAKQIAGQDGKTKGSHVWVLCVVGIRDNKNWCGAWINDYLFGRLEFVKRKCKD